MRPFPALAAACLLAAAVPLALVPTAHDGDRSTGSLSAGPPAVPVDDTPLGRVIGSGRPQTSDGVIGEIAAPQTASQKRAASDPSIRARWQVAPGVQAVIWDERDSRGPIRAYLLAVQYRTPGVSIDYANPGVVHATAPALSQLSRDGAVAGVNGDFFDIGDTNAPLGVGIDLDRGLVHGRRFNWNSGLWFTRSGTPEIGQIGVKTVIKQRPDLEVKHVNGPEVWPGNIGVYNEAWGSTAGYRITNRQTKRIRWLQVNDGVVTAGGSKLRTGRRVTGQLLVGRNEGATALASFHKGDRLTLMRTVDQPARMAITGNQILVDDGLIKVVDDREMHPRTAVGIDRDTRTLLVLAIDGRQSFSRGYTMVELADKLIDLGADEALNLDGGGSTTWAAKRGGKLRVLNSPSDGFARNVANVLSIRYRPANAVTPPAKR